MAEQHSRPFLVTLPNNDDPGEARFLLVRLGSMGDIIHALPAAHALRLHSPQGRIDWLVERKWAPLLEGNPDINVVILLDRSSWGGIVRCIRSLQAGNYFITVDFQGLYKSAVLARASGAKWRLGYHQSQAREGGAALFYNSKLITAAEHIVDRHLALAQSAVSHTRRSREAGTWNPEIRFPMTVPAEADAYVDREIARAGLREFYLISPGGGWQSKCWPAERYGHLHRKLAQKYGWRAMVNCGPGERALAQSVLMVAGQPAPVLLQMDLQQLMAATRRAKFFVGGDTGPLHLAAALGTPVVGLYGPTDPSRNGPYGGKDVVVRMARAGEATYKRGKEYSPAMLRIQWDDVVAAIEQRLRLAK